MSGISSLILGKDNLNPNGSFNIITQSPPYNKLSTNLPSNLQGYEIALQKLNCYYSWANVSSVNYQAATISWPIVASYSTFTWDLTSGYNYSTIAEINDALQSFCINNGLYLINDVGLYVYYITIVANPNNYGIDLTLFNIPTSLPVGWSQPGTWVGYPSTTLTPKIQFKSEFNKLIGYDTTTVFDGGATQTTFTSTFTPALSPTSSILVSCNLSHNPLALNNSSTVMTVFTTRDTSFGASIVVEPNEIVWYDINSNSNILIVELLNQDFNALNILDPDIVVQMLIRKKK